MSSIGIEAKNVEEKLNTILSNILIKNNKIDKKIPLMRPLLPGLQQIAPYLAEIDKNRWYSNFGPLAIRFESELICLFNLSPGELITISNGTLALSLILRALNIPEGSLCIVPSWTFVATAAAPTVVGLEPYFVDVDEESWAIEPELLKDQTRYIPGKVGAVIIVSPFGVPINTEAWDKFTEETGIPVVIDAAAGFDSILQCPEAKPTKTPIMVSLHATKPFGIGEGAIVLSQNKLLLNRIKQLSNYGFTPTREVNMPGINAKLNEYSAAVGLAALETWPQKRQAWSEVTNKYIDAFNLYAGDLVEHKLSKDWVSSVCNVRLPTDRSDEIIDILAHLGIESRRWWQPCHQMKAYINCKRFALPNTEKLYRSVIALPFSVDMQAEDINYITSNLAQIVRHV